MLHAVQIITPRKMMQRRIDGFFIQIENMHFLRCYLFILSMFLFAQHSSMHAMRHEMPTHNCVSIGLKIVCLLTKMHCTDTSTVSETTSLVFLLHWLPRCACVCVQDPCACSDNSSQKTLSISKSHNSSV